MKISQFFDEVRRKIEYNTSVDDQFSRKYKIEK